MFISPVLYLLGVFIALLPFVKSFKLKGNFFQRGLLEVIPSSCVLLSTICKLASLSEINARYISVHPVKALYSTISRSVHGEVLLNSTSRQLDPIFYK